MTHWTWIQIISLLLWWAFLKFTSLVSFYSLRVLIVVYEMLFSLYLTGLSNYFIWQPKFTCWDLCFMRNWTRDSALDHFCFTLRRSQDKLFKPLHIPTLQEEKLCQNLCLVKSKPNKTRCCRYRNNNHSV